MRKFRRKTLLGILEKVAIGFVLLDLVFYLAVVRPLSGSVASQRSSFQSIRRQLLADEARVAHLEKTQASLPVTSQDIQDFLKEHVPPRRRGFSRAASLVRQLTQESGVHLSGVGYRLELSKNEPLQRLGVTVEVEGAFPSLLKFTHSVETASDLILVRGVSLQPGENGTLALRLGADLYVTP